MLEQPMQGRAGPVPGVGQGGAHLTGDLRLADHHRVQPGRHRQGVGDGALADVDLQGLHEGGSLGAEQLHEGPEASSTAGWKASASRYTSNLLQVGSTITPESRGLKKPVGE